MQIQDDLVTKQINQFPEEGASADLIRRLAAPLPRYTSYPTANHFDASVGPNNFKKWVTELEDNAAVSLYLHIPFCDALCWYCACSTKATQRYAPISEYLKRIEAEMLAVAELIPNQHRVTNIHWGGGSPDILTADDILRLGLKIKNYFNTSSSTEFAVEIDPRLITSEKADRFVEIGVNRLSIGVQDFAPEVQKAIGRVQSFETSKLAIDLFRNRGIESINLDLVYGLPLQTEDSLARTIDQVIGLSPDRVAVFGYAHLPQRAHNQKLIDAADLPGPEQRFSMARRLEKSLGKAAYVQLGIDHFARSSDSLARQQLNRNFQGYTTDCADALIGFGASAISRFPEGYTQNAVAVHEYSRRVDDIGFGTVRGWVFSQDDKLRAYIIERLMCDFSFSFDLKQKFGEVSDALLSEAVAIAVEDNDGLVERTDDGFRLTQKGKPFVRNFCARFDSYLNNRASEVKHSVSV